MAQILKASGFDKCKPLVLNTVTELYIKHLELVLSRAEKFALSRSNCPNEILAQDLTQALLDVQLLKAPISEASQDIQLDAKGHEVENNTKSLDSLVKWLQYSDMFNVSKRLAEVPTALIHNLAEKRKIDISAETDQERKRRRLRERQEFYNQFKHGEEKSQGIDRIVDDLDDDEITSDDKLSWLAYLAEKDLKLGHNLKFANTCILDTVMSVHKNKKFHPPSKNGEDSYHALRNHLHNYSKNDYLVLHIQDAEDKDEGEATLQPSSELKEALPYNIRYPDALLNDDIEQYLKYAEEHPVEIEKLRQDTEETKEDVLPSKGKDPSPLGLSGEEKPVVSVLKDVLLNGSEVVNGEGSEKEQGEVSVESEKTNKSIDKNGESKPNGDEKTPTDEIKQDDEANDTVQNAKSGDDAKEEDVGNVDDDDAGQNDKPDEMVVGDGSEKAEGANGSIEPSADNDKPEEFLEEQEDTSAVSPTEPQDVSKNENEDTEMVDEAEADEK